MSRRQLEQHDRHLLDLLLTLSEDEWGQPSLCAGWTNRDVLAHLVLGCRFPIGRLTITMASERCTFDQANDTITRALATTVSTPTLLGELSQHARRLPTRTRLLFPARFLLGDHLTHHLDIALPLHRVPTIPHDALRVILQTQVRIPNPFVPARRRAAGLRIEAPDLDWHHGPADAPLVRGAAAHLVSVLAGRPFALPQLDGPGVHDLRGRLAPANPSGSPTDVRTTPYREDGGKECGSTGATRSS